MKILHIIPNLQTGGAEKLLVELLPELTKLGNDVDLLCISGERTPLYKAIKQQGIRIFSLCEASTSYYSPMHIVRLCCFLRKHKYDVIHSHGTPSQIISSVASLFFKAKFFTTEHSTANRRREWKWARPIDCWMYNRFKKVICISDKAEENLHTYLADKCDKLCTIYNGVDLIKYTTASPVGEIIDKYGKYNKAIMVASFTDPKDQPTIIKAYSMLPDTFHLFFAGVGPHETECKDLAVTLGIEKRVHFLGMRMDVPSLLKSMDEVIMSSHFEGLSLSSIEGMSSGKPFIASDVDGLHEIVAGNGLLFPHEDAKALAGLIMQMATDVDARNRVVDACQNKASQYDIKVMAEKYNNLYKS